MMKATFRPKELHAKRARSIIESGTRTTCLAAAPRMNTKAIAMTFPGVDVCAAKLILIRSKYFGSNVKVAMPGTMLRKNVLALIQRQQRSWRSGFAGLVALPWLGSDCSCVGGVQPLGVNFDDCTGLLWRQASSAYCLTH